MDEARTIAGVSCVGLYYYGARYLDAKYSRWMSTDPAVSDYIPMAPTDDEARKHNQQLPGMGGVFNVVNFQLYHYAGNNPVKYTDPDGKQACPADEVDNLGFELLKNPATAPTMGSIILKFGPACLILAIIGSLHGDSLRPVLPPNYAYDADTMQIIAPNGTAIATIDQAFSHFQGNPDWTKIDGWGKGSFSNANESLLYHFSKHGKEVGAKTAEQYLRKAKNFAQTSKNARKIPSKGHSDATRYSKNGKYIIIDNNTKEILSYGKESRND